MSSVTCYNILQTNILGSFRHIKIHHHIFAWENIRISLSDIIHRIHQRLHTALRHHVASDLTLLHIQFHTGHIPLGSPCININSHVCLSLQCRIKIGNILHPSHTLFPFRDIYRTPLAAQRIIIRTIIPHTERGHKTHQFKGRHIILTRNNTNHFFIFGTVYRRKRPLAFGYIHQINHRFFGKHKTRARFIPTVTIGSYSYFQGNIHIPFIIGQGYFL